MWRAARADPVAAPSGAALQQWAQNNSIELDAACSIDEATVAGLPLCLRASGAIKRGTVVVTVPEDAWLKAPASSGDLPPWAALALELARGRGDPTGAAAFLPETPASPLGWPAEDLELLQGSQAASTLANYRAAVLERLPSDAGVSQEDCLWAVATVRERMHEPLIGSELAVVPVADLVAHSRRPNVKWEIRATGLFGQGPRNLCVVATRDVAPGEELSLDYGPEKLEGQIALDHGAYDAVAGRAGVSLTLELPGDDKMFDDKIDTLEINGFDQAVAFELLPRQPPSEDMLAFLRLVSLSGPDAFLMEPIFRNEAWAHMSLPVSEENEAAVCEAMGAALDAALEGIGSTPDEESAIIRATGGRGRAGLAAAIRLGELEALGSARRWFATRATEEVLGQLEYYAERRLKRLGLMDKEGNNTE
ncbi:unnamed protein product [Pedinophyceae sp. YPF-701]|nr:unnamed protein product [Pedinophyceae sp. YPF-701]